MAVETFTQHSVDVVEFGYEARFHSDIATICSNVRVQCGVIGTFKIEGRDGVIVGLNRIIEDFYG